MPRSASDALVMDSTPSSTGDEDHHPRIAMIDAPAAPENTIDSARLLTPLLTPIASDDTDPYATTDSTAAIAAESGGDDEGAKFVRVQRIQESTTAFGLAFAHANSSEVELPRLSGISQDGERGVSSTTSTPPASSTPPPPPAPQIARQNFAISAKTS